MKPRGVVYATGAVSAIGATATETAMLLRTGLPALGEAPLAGEDTKSGVTMGFTRLLAPTRFGAERAAELLGLALDELAADVRRGGALELRDLELRAAVALTEDATSSVSPLRRQVLGLLTSKLGKVDVRFSPPNGPGGAAGAAHVLDDALTALTLREVDAVLLAGVHTDYDPERIAALRGAERLFSADRPDAVLPGEAASVLLIGRPDLTHRLRLPSRLELYAVGTAKGDVTPTNDASVYEDHALSDALEAATRELADELRVGFALTDLGCEQHRVREFYAALTRLTDKFMEPMSVDAPAQRIGALGAAAVPLNLAVASEMMRRAYAPSSLGLIVAGSDDGARAAVLAGSPS